MKSDNSFKYWEERILNAVYYKNKSNKIKIIFYKAQDHKALLPYYIET